MQDHLGHPQYIHHMQEFRRARNRLTDTYTHRGPVHSRTRRHKTPPRSLDQSRPSHGARGVNYTWGSEGEGEGLRREGEREREKALATPAPARIYSLDHTPGAGERTGSLSLEREREDRSRARFSIFPIAGRSRGRVKIIVSTFVDENAWFLRELGCFSKWYMKWKFHLSF